ncbi:MAG: bifunctional 2',3'-cyclic-nucleotide 2'-phosphodiesterase/3'-nucleotidase [Brevibacillus sp.]|nr:bifunctional 2',3'-cyclic-nucleotide 2'-phosphodiesterase/3'-nucleotidase [Brevibacillus sp.]
MKKKWLNSFLSSALLLGSFVLPAAAKAADQPVTLKLRLMETTDIHVNLVNYDYYKDTMTDEFGLAKTATLIKQARAEAANSMLFDNGDLIQGNPLGDYVAKVDPLKDGEVHPVYKAMNLLDYDAGNIGNHEFNYGLDFLQTSLKGSNFPYVNANVYIDDHDDNPDNDQNYFTPYLILERTFTDENGNEQVLNVGVIGFVPPQIMQWDKNNLEGKVIAKDIIETARKFVPEMKEKGADIIVAIPHSGFGSHEMKGNDENATYLLSKVEGIDAILFGHSHVVFPGPAFEGAPGVDNVKGTINGVPAVEPGFWGDHLGIIDLTLTKADGKWQVTDSQAEARPISKKEGQAIVPLVEADTEIVEAVKEDHEATLEYVRGPVATTTAPINSYFALVHDDPSIQIVTNAQKWYVEKSIQGTELEGIPVLSAGAPFKAGGRGGANYYTDIPAGTIAVKNVSDLYIYPNTLKAVLVDGAAVKEWLERSAGQFNQIDPNKKEEQPLINTSFPTYNFDVIDGVTYQIDVTQPPRYDLNGNLVNPAANRITNLAYNGRPVEDDQKFIVVTNNYRAGGGGNFPGLDGSNIVIDSPDESRQIVINYLMAEKTINPSADNNWSFAPIAGNPLVTFETSPNAEKYAKEMADITYLETLDTGFAKYKITLSDTDGTQEELVPVRATAEKNGVEVSYDFSTRLVTLSKGEVKLEYTLGTKQAFINGRAVEVTAKIVSDRLYLPASVLEGAFDN